jgi:SAM-dependent methyltransferase
MIARQSSARRTRTVTDRVREQYEAYPFPAVTRIYEEDPERDLRASYNLDFGLVGPCAMPSGAELWIAGASTRWAVLVALQLGDVKIIASDLSERALAFQSKLARALKIENIDFRNEDLTKVGYKGRFHYASCAGVLHHLADPAKGLAVLRRALAPGGLIELMLYDPINRRLAHRMQAALGLLLPADADAALRLETARELLVTLSPALFAEENPLRRLGREMERATPEQLSDLADLVSHPHEVAYDVRSLLDFLASAKLGLRQWKNPQLFEPRWMLEDGAMIEQLERLPHASKWHVCQLLANPLLELFAETQPVPRSPAPADIEAMRVRACAHRLEHHIASDGSVERTVRKSRIARREGGLRVTGIDRSPCVSAYAFDSVVPEIAGELLAMAKKPIAIGDLAGALARRHRLSKKERSSLVGLCERLCRPPVRLLAVVA